MIGAGSRSARAARRRRPAPAGTAAISDRVQHERPALPGRPPRERAARRGGGACGRGWLAQRSATDLARRRSVRVRAHPADEGCASRRTRGLADACRCRRAPVGGEGELGVGGAERRARRLGSAGSHATAAQSASPGVPRSFARGDCRRHLPVCCRRVRRALRPDGSVATGSGSVRPARAAGSGAGVSAGASVATRLGLDRRRRTVGAGAASGSGATGGRRGRWLRGGRGCRRWRDSGAGTGWGAGGVAAPRGREEAQRIEVAVRIGA